MSSSQQSPPEQVDAVVVGAGFAGLYQLYRLRELGLSTRVFETADGVGGTWYWNRYPGARCDVESMAYSYSFSEELEQEWEWSERYATQPEILRYAHHVSERFDLLKDIDFNTIVTGAVYDHLAHSWTVTTDTGERVTARFVIMATGCLSAASLPRISGIGSFTGATYHTARWPHEGVDFTGKRVAVIGTGSSGIQSIPLIAEQAAELTVFQRTPHYTLPARNRPLREDEVRERKAGYREFREELRHTPTGIPRELPTHGAFEVTAEERESAYEAAWDAGVLGAFSTAFTDLLVSPAANETAAEFVRDKIRSVVADPATAEALCPRDYPLGTKRPCMDTDYYATYNKPHVRLVDLRATSIEEITEKGVRTADREYQVDAIVFATGFDALTGALAAIDIRGRQGLALRDKWAAGPRNYLGLVSAGFPNLFTVTGPLSPSVLSNMMVSIEQHVEWITDCIAYLRRNGLTEIDTTTEVEDAWTEHVAEVASGTLYPQAASWYMGANVPGKPRIFMPYLGGVGAYRVKCGEVAADGYAGFTLSSSAAERTEGVAL
ncbi:NAD(P)/FAD-dependent oxidoreductase [Streptomyces sp. NPDC001982]|uniref:flavin-containing monooxygenase n=1 Tax=unclassified Streptomyces TaxID=2593676 RepID=UPI00331AE2BE